MSTRRELLKGGLLGLSSAWVACSSTQKNILGDVEKKEDYLPASTGPELPNETAASINTAAVLDETVSLHLISGEYPNDMFGHSFVVFAEPHHENASLFAGHGVVVRFDYHEERVDVQMEFAQTPCYFADRATEGTSDAFAYSDLSRFSNTLGSRVLANTAFVPMGDRLLVTYDAGRPHEIDPISLKVQTPVGRMDAWKSVTPEWMGMFMKWPFPIMMSTAHPAWDHEQEKLYMVNFAPSDLSMSPYLYLLRWDGEGAMESWELKLPNGQQANVAQSVHQMCVTRNHIIICDTAFASEFMDVFGFSNQSMHRTETLFYIIEKSSLSSGGGIATAHPITIPRESIHFLADFDDSDGFLTLHVSHNVSADGSEFLREGDTLVNGDTVREDLIGIIPAPMDLGALGKYTIDTQLYAVLESEVLIKDPWMWGGPGFYAWNGQDVPERFTSLYWHSTGISQDTLIERMVEVYADHPYRTIALEDLPVDGCPSTIFRQDVQNMEIVDGYVFPVGRHGSSPEFIPRKGSTDDTDGYIVCVVVSDDDSQTNSTGDEIWIFQADDLAKGPIARLGHPQLDMPFTLHSCWMESVQARQATYNVDVEQDLSETVQSLSSELQSVFAQHVYPNFRRE